MTDQDQDDDEDIDIERLTTSLGFAQSLLSIYANKPCILFALLMLK